MATPPPPPPQPPPSTSRVPRLSSRVQRQGRYWYGMTRGTPEQQRQLLRYATPDQVNAMSEVVYNVLCGNVPLSRKALRVLQPQKHLWRSIGDPRRPWTARHKDLQKGGGKTMAMLLRSVKRGVRRGIKQGARQVQQRSRQRPPPPPPPPTVSTDGGEVEEEEDHTHPSHPATTPKSRSQQIRQLERDIAKMETTLQTMSI